MAQNSGYQILAVHPGLAGLARDKIIACASDDCRFAGQDPAVVAAGVAVIPVKGVLIHDDSCWSGWGVTTYSYIRAKVDAAMADPSISALALVFNSGGGAVAGCFDLADHIRAARLEKPIVAYVDEFCCSAAYALASACSRIVIPRTGVVGSIGVIMEHWDFSGALESDGVKVTEIFSGDHKADGSRFAALAKSVKDRLTKECDAVRRLFAELVAAGRDLAVSDILATEAQTYRGEEAVKIGLADEVAAVDVAFDNFCKQNQKDNAMKALSGRMTGRARAAKTTDDEDDQPKESGRKAKKAEAEDDEDDQPKESGRKAQKAKKAKAEDDDPEAEDDEDDQPDAEEDGNDADAEDDEENQPDAEEDEDGDRCGKKSRASAEQRRIRAILTAPQAKGREKLAQHLAFETKMSVQRALSMLSAAPAAQGGLSGKMPPNAIVGAADHNGASSAAQSVLASMKRAGYR